MEENDKFTDMRSTKEEINEPLEIIPDIAHDRHFADLMSDVEDRNQHRMSYRRRGRFPQPGVGTLEMQFKSPELKIPDMLSLVDSGGVDIFDTDPNNNTIGQKPNRKTITLLTCSEKIPAEMKIPDNKTRQSSDEKDKRNQHFRRASWSPDMISYNSQISFVR